MNEQLELPVMPKKKFAKIPDKESRQQHYLIEKGIRKSSYIMVGTRPISIGSFKDLVKVHGLNTVKTIISSMKAEKFRNSSEALLALVDGLIRFKRYRK